MLSLSHFLLLACVLATADTVILGRRRSSSWGNSWGNNWGNSRRNSWEPEKYRGWEGRSEGWGWWGGARDQWGRVSRSENNDWSWNNNNNDGWGRNNRWNSRSSSNSRRSSTKNRWGRKRSRQNTRSNSRSRSRSSSSSRGNTANSWYYQMICKNSYTPLMQSNGSPYYCSWYSPCPQNGGYSSWYQYKYRCTNNGEGNMGLCCVDAGEISSIFEF